MSSYRSTQPHSDLLTAIRHDFSLDFHRLATKHMTDCVYTFGWWFFLFSFNFSFREAIGRCLDKARDTVSCTAFARMTAASTPPGAGASLPPNPRMDCNIGRRLFTCERRLAGYRDHGCPSISNSGHGQPPWLMHKVLAPEDTAGGGRQNMTNLGIVGFRSSHSLGLGIYQPPSL